MMNQKINAILFSRDRAAQLKIFLDSVLKNAPDVFDLNVIVEHTEDEFDKAYGKIIHDPKYSDINFVGVESEFKDQVLEIMKTKHDYFTFFLDDDIIYRNIKLNEITNQIESDESVVCFSLRLGENTTKCYTLGVENVMHGIKHYENFMKWDWSLHYLDFGYPFSVNGHIFRRKDIYKIVKKTKFTNVESLEVGMFDFAETFPRNLMVSYENSVLVNVPHGRVQKSIEGDMAGAVKQSEARIKRRKINNLFLDGNFIDLESIDFSNIEGCHQELDFGDGIDVESSSLDKLAIRQHGKRWDEITKEEQNEIKNIVKDEKK